MRAGFIHSFPLDKRPDRKTECTNLAPMEFECMVGELFADGIESCDTGAQSAIAP